MHRKLTLSLAKLAPSSISPAGIHTAPMKAAVSSKNARGGFPSGPFGMRVPVHPGVLVNNALSAGISAQGSEMTTARDTGIRKLFSIVTIFDKVDARLIDVTGDGGWWYEYALPWLDVTGRSGSMFDLGAMMVLPTSTASVGAVGGIERVDSSIEVKEGVCDGCRVGTPPPT